MRPEFTNPEFVQNSDPDIIQERMMGNLPADISDIPGDFPYDLTMPAAVEISQLIQFDIVRSLMTAFPEYAWGSWLDLHGVQVNVKRRGANCASGYLTVTGTAGTVIEPGTVFCVPASSNREALEYTADHKTELLEESQKVAVTAVQAGVLSNTPAGTITIMLKPQEGIWTITNEEPVTGGTDTEDDSTYYERIHEAYSEENSYVGNDRDLIRWAKEVPGVGECSVDAAWNGPGTVKLILSDSSGIPANDQLLEAVYEHIISPDDRSRRLMPAGSGELTVAAAKTKQVSYTCTGVVLSGITIADAQAAFKTAVSAVYAGAKEAGVLRYNRVRPVLAGVDGIEDFDDFLMDGGYANLVIAPDECVATGEVVFSV